MGDHDRCPSCGGQSLDPPLDGCATPSWSHARPWIFTVAVRMPNLIRAPGLDNPDNWDFEGMKDENWEATYLTIDYVEEQLRKVAPEGTVLRRDTGVSVEVTTPDFAWFEEWYRGSPSADIVHVWQTPTRPKEGDDALYMFDETGVLD